MYSSLSMICTGNVFLFVKLKAFYCSRIFDQIFDNCLTIFDQNIKQTYYFYLFRTELNHILMIENLSEKYEVWKHSHFCSFLFEFRK
jgi:hypothetical protein